MQARHILQHRAGERACPTSLRAQCQQVDPTQKQQQTTPGVRQQCPQMSGNWPASLARAGHYQHRPAARPRAVTSHVQSVVWVAVGRPLHACLQGSRRRDRLVNFYHHCRACRQVWCASAQLAQARGMFVLTPDFTFTCPTPMRRNGTVHPRSGSQHCCGMTSAQTPWTSVAARLTA